jgi:hypothetical protein
MKKKTQKKKEKQESYLNVIVRREKNIKKNTFNYYQKYAKHYRRLYHRKIKN